MARCPRCKSEVEAHLPTEERGYQVLDAFAESLDFEERWKVPFIGDGFPSPEYDEDTRTSECDRCGETYRPDDEPLEPPAYPHYPDE